MKMDSRQFRVKEGSKVRLDQRPTLVKPFFRSKADYKNLLDRHKAELSELQNRLYAHNRYSLLLIFQAMDAAGRDSVIKHVMSGVNLQGCQVFSFKHPSAEELEHDFLWRSTRSLPERGRIGIFNRSYYEEVLIVRVHPEILRNEALPDELAPTGRFATIDVADDETSTNVGYVPNVTTGVPPVFRLVPAIVIWVIEKLAAALVIAGELLPPLLPFPFPWASADATLPAIKQKIINVTVNTRFTKTS